MPTCPHCGATSQNQPIRLPANMVPIQDLDVSVRARNCLMRHGMTTAADLVSLTYLELLEIRKLGTVSAVEVVSALYRLGLVLRPERASS